MFISLKQSTVRFHSTVRTVYYKNKLIDISEVHYRRPLLLNLSFELWLEILSEFLM